MKALKFLFAIVVVFISCKENKKEAVKPLETKIKVEVLDSIKLSNGVIKRIENFPSKYVRPRNVDVWLPDNYFFYYKICSFVYA